MRNRLIITFMLFNLYGYSQTNTESDSVKKQEFIILEDPAMPPGGYQELYQYIGEQIKFTKKMRKKRLKGKVYVEFVIKEDGYVDQSKVRVLSKNEVENTGFATQVKRIIDDEEYGNSVVDAIKNMPKWKPGKHKGELRKQRIIIPITFR